MDEMTLEEAKAALDAASAAVQAMTDDEHGTEKAMALQAAHDAAKAKYDALLAG